MDDPRPFGAHFADAWTLLQRYLSDIDERELEELRGMDRAATLALLLRQPELMENAARSLGPDVGPEELATRIVLERLNALQAGPTPGGDFGARFLSAWRKHGGPMTGFRYKQIQALKKADRAESKRLLSKGLVGMSYAQRQALDELEPEEFARRLLNELMVTRAVMVGLFF